ncbi:MAG: TadE/TadG family type IV pilus assembly protein [Rhizobiaceae bacterium]
MTMIFEKETAMLVKKTSRNRVEQLVREFRNDESGVSAVEFALVSPFLLGTWLGLVAILDTEHTTTKVGKVTATVADIIAQAPAADSDYINAAFNAGNAMLGTTASANLKIYVAGVEVEADQSVNVIWICGRHFSEQGMTAAEANLDLPQQLKQAPGFVVASYGEYTHTPIYGDKFTGDQTYKYNNYFVPRNSLQTLNDGCDG